MKSWPRVTLRTFAVLHILMASEGLALGTVHQLRQLLSGAILTNVAEPYVHQVFLVDTTFDAFCLVLLIPAGLALWRLDRRGVRLSNVILGSEIVYLLLESQLTVWLQFLGHKAALIGLSIAAATGIGGLGTALQLMTGYPLVGLIAINVAWRKLNRASRAPASLQGGGEAGWKPWPRAVLRVFGLLDVVVGLWGLYSAPFLGFVVIVTGKTGVDAGHPYVLLVETVVAVLSFLLLTLTGIALWRLKRQGLRLSGALVGGLVIFLMIEQGLRLLLSTRGGEAKALADSIGNSFGSPLLIALILYNTIAVLVIALAFRRMRAAAAQNAPVACQ